MRSFEQQILLSRKKRDFLPEPDLHQYRRSVDLEHHEEPEFYSREKRYEDKQHGREDKMFFNDDLYSKMWYYVSTIKLIGTIFKVTPGERSGSVVECLT